MDDFGQIIGLILAILFFAVGALRKKNKAGSAQQTTAKENDIFDVLFDSGLTNNDDIFVQARATNRVYEPTEEKKVQMVENVQPQVVHNEKKVVKQVKTKKKNKFDIKQAVIYSEILNRKYT